MPYFTSWDANLYLCLCSLGLHHDISLSMTRRIKKVHINYCSDETLSYYLDRKKWLPQIGSEKSRKLLRDRQADWAYGYGKEINMKVLCPIKTISNDFWLLIQKVNWDYERKLEKIEPEDRNDYFEWAYENHYHGWDRGVFEWVKGFHPGRWILMDMKRGEVMEDIRDLEDYGAYIEERFIRGKDHIDDLIAGKSLYNM